MEFGMDADWSELESRSTMDPLSLTALALVDDDIEPTL